MKEKLTLKNTYISSTASSRERSIKIGFLGSKDKDIQALYFTPSFMGQGWETSLLPKIERGYFNDFSFSITFSWLKKLLSKMQKRQEERRQSWTTAIARLFL